MRQIIRFGFILGLVASSSAFSADPVPGFYLGLLGQLSHAPNTDLSFSIDNSLPSIGSIQLGVVGGGAGFSIGYKISNFRVEGEFLANVNNYGQLTVGSCTLISPTVLGPQGVCPDIFEQTGLAFNGYTLGFYGFVNGFYEFLYDPDWNFAPYLGVGVGGAIIKNHALFHSNNQCISLGTCSPIINTTIDTSTGGFAAQGMVGFNYYLDDFTTIGLDFRYASTVNFNKNNTSSTSSNSNNNFGIAMISLTGNFALEKAD